jgi:ribosomal protein S18 acetylase RimI-like enzyme
MKEPSKSRNCPENGIEMEMKYRQGRREDCRELSSLVDEASGGVVDFLFHDLLPGITPIQVVAQNLAADHEPHTYKNTVVAVADGSVAGLALSYPSRLHRISEEMRAFLPAERLAYLDTFYASRVEDSLYLDALAVKSSFRGQGVGSRLLDRVRERALDEDFPFLSLMVFADNDNAIRLYLRHGFEVFKKIPLARHPRIPHVGGCLLMRCRV